MFSSSIHELLISDILVERGERQRKEIDTTGLKESIAKRGLATPIIVRKHPDVAVNKFILIAGERRLTSCTELGHRTISARLAEELSPVEHQIVELEENFQRQDLTWQEQAEAIARVHSLYLALDPEWSMTQTAESLCISLTAVSRQLRLAEEMRSGNEKVATAGGQAQAYNLLLRKDSRAMGKALEELIGASPQPAPTPAEPQAPGKATEASGKVEPTQPEPEPEPDVLCASFLDWAPGYAGEKFNLLHCDFPYGVDLFHGEYGQRGSDIEYRDEKDIYFTLLEAFCKHLDNFCSLSAHLVFWYSMKHHDATMTMFRQLAPSFEILPHPLVWGKSDNAGIIGDARRHPRHIYETALFGIRGSRQVVSSKGDFYHAPTDRALHPSAKPEPVLRHFLTMLVDEHTRLLDPTCGAGSALRAADSLGAARVFGIELDPTHAETAQTALNNSRRLKSASRLVDL